MADITVRNSIGWDIMQVGGMNAAVDSTEVARARLYHLFAQLDEPQKEKARGRVAYPIKLSGCRFSCPVGFPVALLMAAGLLSPQVGATPTALTLAARWPTPIMNEGFTPGS